MPRLARAPRQAPGSPLTTLCKTQVLQIFLQYCYSAILSLELHCSNIVKYKYIYIYFFYSLSLKFLSPLSHYLCSLLSLPSLFLICSLLFSDPNIILLLTSTSHITVEETLIWVFFFFFFLSDVMML